MEQKLPDFLDDGTCSSTECTGLIASAPRNADERRNYEDVYKYLPPRIKSKKKSKKK